MTRGMAVVFAALALSACGGPSGGGGSGEPFPSGVPGEASLRSAATAFLDAVRTGQCDRAVALTSGEATVVAATRNLCSLAASQAWTAASVVSDSFSPPVRYTVVVSITPRDGAPIGRTLVLEQDAPGFRVHEISG